MSQFRQSAVRARRGVIFAAGALALVSSAGAALAQATIITRQPVQERTVVTTAPLQLTPVQRQTVYRTIVREPAQAPAQATVEYRVGTRIPSDARLYAMPQDVAVEVPSVRSYKYMTVNSRVWLVDPETSEIVAEVAE